jgi:hypothetical protein
MITVEQLQAIIQNVEQHGLDHSTPVRLRELYPGMHFTYCLDDDINHARPVEERTCFNVYLVETGHHCLGLTTDLVAASGVVLAELVDE